jgi:hypothetical protein
MTKIAILISLITIATMLSDPVTWCPKYICNKTSAVEGGLCLEYNGTDYLGAKCNSKQRCPNILTSTKSSCKDKGFDGIPKLPGERAYQDSDCLSGKMQNTYCVANALGASCTSHTDCDVGLICIMPEAGGLKTCLPAKKDGEKCDHFSNICASGVYCDNKDFVCHYYGTDKVGTKVGTLGQAVECESFFLDVVDKVTCIKPPKRISDELVNIGDKCQFNYTTPTNTQGNFVEEAACGMTATGQAWCDPDYESLDTQRSNLIKFLQNNNETAPCHIYSPFPFCERAKVEMSGFMDAIKAYFELKIHDYDELYKTVVKVDKCFYDANPMYYYGGALEITTAAVITMLALLI